MKFPFSLLLLISLVLHSCQSEFPKTGDLEFRQVGKSVSIPTWTMESGFDLYDIWVGPQDSSAWIVGSNGCIWSFQDNKWSKDSSGFQAADGRTLRSIWMAPDLKKGWAVGETILKYANGKWKEDKNATKLIGANTLFCVHMDSMGQEGWAVGKNGRFLKFEKNRWKRERIASRKAGGEDINSIWMDFDEGRGWAVGEFCTLLSFCEGTWEKDLPEGQTSLRESLNGICVGPAQKGFAVGLNGTIFKFEMGQWKVDTLGTNAANGTHLNSICYDQTLENAWAVGDGGKILKYSMGNWELDTAGTRASQGFSLLKVYLTKNGKTVWAVGENGRILRYLKGRWEAITEGIQFASGNSLSTIWIDSRSGNSWAGGYRGFILSHKGQDWNIDSLGIKNTRGQHIRSIWMDPTFEQGWAVGSNGIVLKYRKGDWFPDSTGIKNAGGQELLDLWIEPTLNLGYAVGDRGTILKWQHGQWKADLLGSTQSQGKDLKSVQIDPETNSGWAVGQDGVILKLEKGNWSFDEESSGIAAGNTLEGLWIEPFNKKGWAVGEDGTILELNNGKWTAFQSKVESMKQARLYAVWTNPKDGTGWAVGQRGTIIRFHDGKWTNYSTEEHLVNHKTLRSLVIDPDLLSGWAVGDSGIIMRYNERENLNTSRLTLHDNSSNPFQLRDSFTVETPFEVFDLELELYSDEDFDILDSRTKDYKIKISESRKSTTVVFNKQAARRKKQFQEKIKLTLQFKVHRTLPIRQGFTTGFIRIESRPKWWLIPSSVVFLLLVNVILIYLARYNLTIRGIILSATWWEFVNALLSIKFFTLPFLAFTYLLLKWCKNLRLGLFKWYQERLPKLSVFQKWDDENRDYISPQIGGDYHNQDWSRKFEAILNDPRQGILWLIEGRSGLGKTALMEQWTKLALQKELTPIFIDLKNQNSPEEEITHLFRNQAGLNLQTKTALKLVKWGDFIVFLDSYNENLNPTEVTNFVREVMDKDIIILASQIPPDWSNLFHKVEKINLRLFGLEQLKEIVGEEYAQKISNAKHLLALDRRYPDHSPNPEQDTLELLPISARLLKKYITEHKSIPFLKLDIYRELDRNLRPMVRQALQEKSWQTFIENKPFFEALPEGNLRDEDLNTATDSGLLTKTRKANRGFSVRTYEFTHGLIYCYLIASHIHNWRNSKTEKLSISEIINKSNPWQSQHYWPDILEFLGELYSEQERNLHFLRLKSAIHPDHEYPFKEYSVFISEVQKINSTVFKSRLLPQFIRLHKSLKLSEKPEYLETLGRFSEHLYGM